MPWDDCVVEVQRNPANLPLRQAVERQVCDAFDDCIRRKI
jgi:hypothetical protein